MPLDMMKALMAARTNPATNPDDLPEEDTSDDSEDDQLQRDPRGMSADGKTLFIDKDMFPDNCKIGDEVLIHATVTKHGAKYGVVPGEIVSKASAGDSNSAE